VPGCGQGLSTRWRLQHDHQPDPIISSPQPSAPWDIQVTGCKDSTRNERKFKADPIGYFHIDVAEVRTVLTDNCIYFTHSRGNSWAAMEIKALLKRKELFRIHAFELACTRNDIGRRPPRSKHPWTNGLVERMKQKIKEAMVERFYYESDNQLRAILRTSLSPTTSPNALSF